MPCSPIDINIPSGPSAPAIPGFGAPFALKIPQISPFPAGFPEGLLDLFNKFQFLIPSGILKPSLYPNFSKDIFDTILSMLDQFFPFLMLYKFFLPLLNIIVCIIEVICSLMNPFALISAVNRLFNKCIPQFLNMFPVFALIIMIISLLLLILALIEYIVAQILKLVEVILKNIIALENAFQSGDSNGVLAIAAKLGSLLCVFQNLFVLFSIFNIILDIIKDILGMAFSIPPCQDGGSGNTNSCCTPETCPTIVKSNYTRVTGIFKYFPETGGTTTISGFPPPFNTSNFILRDEKWQLYDLQQDQSQAFRNIFDAFDVTNVSPKPVFFPADATYNAVSDIRQVPYLFDMRMYYNPISWGRSGDPRFIRFTNVIMPQVPTTSLTEADNSIQNVFNAVSGLTGGLGFEDDGVTPLQGFAEDGVTPISNQATINNFFHMASLFYPSSSFVQPNINDGYTFNNVEYTFKPNIAPLLQRNIVTAGCVPNIAFSKDFVNNVFASDISLKTQLLNNLVNGNTFPDLNGAEQCLQVAIDALRTNMTTAGVADFQATCTLCLNKLQTDTTTTLGTLIGLGIDPCSSSFTINPNIQFTSKSITVSVNINEKNGLSLTNNLPSDIASNVADSLKAHITFGQVSNFTYDGYQAFTAEISSKDPGTGQVMVSFDNNIFCTNTFLPNNEAPPTHTLQAKDYQFIYTPVHGITPSGDSSDGQPRRDDGDLARDQGNS